MDKLIGLILILLCIGCSNSKDVKTEDDINEQRNLKKTDISTMVELIISESKYALLYRSQYPKEMFAIDLLLTDVKEAIALSIHEIMSIKEDYYLRYRDYILENIHKYNVQIIPYLDNGIICIECNYFIPGQDTKQWRTNYILVHDGGANYWNFKYRYNTKEKITLWINGES